MAVLEMNLGSLFVGALVVRAPLLGCKFGPLIFGNSHRTGSWIAKLYSD